MSPVQSTILMKGSQIGASQAGLAFVLYIIAVGGGPAIVVCPTIAMAELYSKQRLDPLIVECDEARAKVPPNKGKNSGNTLRLKTFPGGMVRLTGGNTYEWSVPFEDIVASGFSTAWRARIKADDVDLPGGWAEGKVVSFTVKDSAAAGSYPKATIRIASCDGTGEAGAPGDLTVGYTGQPWDRVAIAAFSGYPPTPGPVPGSEAYLENGVADQLAYVQGNDFRGNVPGRDDASANDPKQVLRKVPTKITLAMNPISGSAGVQDFIPLAVSAWPGPRQCNPPSPDA